MDHIKFLKKIGSKGGQARKTNPRRSQLAREAALKRWEAYKKCKVVTKPDKTT